MVGDFMSRRALMTPIVALALCLPSLLRAGDQPKGDKDLDGDWELQSSVEDGVKQTLLPQVIQIKLSFKEESVVGRTIVGGDVVSEFTRRLVIDAAKKPKRIDILPDADDCNPQTVKAIYEVKIDELRLCVAKPGKDRPTDLSSKKGSGWTLWTLRCLSKK
jgi:uncharacterized protein (TIGR03067 family)